MQANNPSIREAETGGSQVQGQPQQFSETLFENKIKKRVGGVAQR